MMMSVLRACDLEGRQPACTAVRQRAYESKAGARHDCSVSFNSEKTRYDTHNMRFKMKGTKYIKIYVDIRSAHLKRNLELEFIFAGPSSQKYLAPRESG